MSWSAPEDDGELPILSYLITWRQTDEQTTEDRRVGSDVNSTVLENLEGGKTYEVSVIAVNRVGGGPSVEAEQKPIGVPSSPIDPVLVLGVDTLSISWSAPNNNGGATISGYEIRWKEASEAAFGEPRTTGSQATSTVIDSLDSGSEYDVSVTALNFVGGGPSLNWSGWTVADVQSVPGPPQQLVAETGLDGVVVSWSAPEIVGESAVTAYRVRWGEGPNDATEVTATEFTLPEINPAELYFVRVSALNSHGAGTPALSLTLPNIVPPPTQASAASRDGALLLGWIFLLDRSILTHFDDADATKFLLQWKSGEESYSSTRQAVAESRDLFRLETLQDQSNPRAPTANGSYELSNLENGTLYTVRMSAIGGAGNDIGVEVMGVPEATTEGAPIDVVAHVTPQDSKIQLSWQVPSTGEADSYLVQWRIRGADSDEWSGDSVTATKYTTPSLTVGEVYDFRVAALDAQAEPGPWTTAIAEPMPDVENVSMLRRFNGDHSATVSWDSPDRDATVLAYRVEWKSPFFYRKVYTLETSIEIPFSDPDQELHVGVAVVGPNGTGATTWRAVKGLQLAGPPKIARLTAGDTVLDAAWRQPDHGGTPNLTGYRLQWRRPGETYDTTRQAEVSTNNYQISGLTNGEEYDVRVGAVNSVGVGPWREMTGAAGTAASAETIRTPTVIAGDQNLLVSWGTPNGQDANNVTGYRVQWKHPGETYDTTRQAEVSTNEYQISGLTNGEEYDVRVLALVGEQTGPAVFVQGVPAGEPAHPEQIAVLPMEESVLVSWAAPLSDGGSPVTHYIVLWKSGTQQFSNHNCSRRRAVVASGLSYAIANLDNDTEYQIQVFAVNSIGHKGGPVYRTTPTAGT